MTVVSAHPPSAGDAPIGSRAPNPDGDEPGAGAQRRGRRRPGSLRRTTWRFWLFAPVLAVLIVAGPLLAWKGFSILRTEDTGQVIGAVTDPAAPGFQALVTPTPTALLLDLGPRGVLTGVTLLTRPTQDGGGNVVLFPMGTVLEVPLRTPPEATLDQIYAEGGASALEQRIETMLGAGIAETIEVPLGQWARLVEPVAPITVQNPVAVQYTNAAGETVSLPDGPVELNPEQVGLYLQARGADETDPVRLTRHEAFWTAWMAALDTAGPSAVPGEGETGIGGAVRGLSGGPVNVMTLPVTPVAIPGASLVDSDLFRPNELELAVIVPDLIPFPVGVGRLRTRLVMGVEGQGDLLPEAAHSLVQAGAEISVIANDEEFDEEQTVVYFFRENQREKAQRLLDALGVGRLVQDPGLSDTSDAVVILGRDYVDAISGGGTPATTAVPGATVPGSVPTGGGVAPGAPGGDPVG